MARRKLRKIKYKVTGAFGCEEVGAIIDAYLLIEDSCGASALVYHPRSRGCCASIEMAHDNGEGVYISSAGEESDMFGWLNIVRQRDLDALIENLQTLNYKNTRR
jgi:hypothetical protein